jgi:RmlD substrate binding domain
MVVPSRSASRPIVLAMGVVSTDLGGRGAPALVCTCRSCTPDVTLCFDVARALPFRSSLGMTHPAALDALFQRRQAAPVVSCAAFTHLDGAEQDPGRPFAPIEIVRGAEFSHIT